jgi:Arc/MetJ-type ribon-helix-helix transcriptional regulator
MRPTSERDHAERMGIPQRQLDNAFGCKRANWGCCASAPASPRCLDDRWGGRRPLNVARSHPYTIHSDGKTDGANGPQCPGTQTKGYRNRKKITINLGLCRFGHVDLMVQDGFYSNRTDFIRTAIRNQLERHADVVKQSTARKGLDLGLRNYSREDLEVARRAGEMLHINVLGLASIAQDVTADLARATIASVSVLGALHATPAVKAALADRTR